MDRGKAFGPGIVNQGSVAGAFLGIVEAADNLLEDVATLIALAVAGHAHLVYVASLVAVLAGLDGFERHQLGVHLLLDELDLGLLDLQLGLVLHVSDLHIPLDIEFVVLTVDLGGFFVDDALLDCVLVLQGCDLVGDLSLSHFALGIDLQLPGIVLVGHLVFGVVDYGELSQLLVLLLGDLLVDLVLVDLTLKVRFVALLLHDELFLAADFVDLALDHESVELRLLLHLLAIIGLHVNEQRGRADYDVGDLYGLKPDAPALDDLEHLLLDRLAHLGALAEHLLNRRVSDAVADDGRRHRDERLVSVFGLA